MTTRSSNDFGMIDLFTFLHDSSRDSLIYIHKFLTINSERKFSSKDNFSNFSNRRGNNNIFRSIRFILARITFVVSMVDGRLRAHISNTTRAD